MEVDVDLGAQRCVVMSRLLSKQRIENPVLPFDVLSLCLFLRCLCALVHF